MPGTLKPKAFGLSISNLRISSAGTWPSIKYLPIVAVWHDLRSIGMAKCDLIDCKTSSFTKFTSVLKLSEIILSTHAPQQPHDSVRFTIKTSEDAKTLLEKEEIAYVPIINSRRIINRPLLEKEACVDVYPGFSFQ